MSTSALPLTANALSPEGKFRDSAHVLLAGQKVRSVYESPTQDVMDSERDEEFQIVSLQALIEMKLNSFRDKDRTHLRDSLKIGLIDETWLARFSPTLAARLQELIDDPERQARFGCDILLFRNCCRNWAILASHC